MRSSTIQAVVQIYGRKKCQTTRKAVRFFAERQIEVQNVDLDQRTPGARELELFIQVVGADRLLDTESKEYKKRGLAYMEFDVSEELAGNPRLIRTPVVRSGREVVAGDDQAGWKRIAEGEKS